MYKWVREPKDSGLSTRWLFDLARREQTRILAFHPTGSKYMCNPSVTDTDEDWVVLVTDRWIWEPTNFRSSYVPRDGYFHTRLWPSGYHYSLSIEWDMNGEAYDEGKFTSYKRKIGDVTYNLIVTDNEEWYGKFVEATLECKRLNLTLKEDRIKLFEKYVPKNETT